VRGDVTIMQESDRAGNSQNGRIITVEGLTVGYGETVVLENVSFSIGEGEAFTILGPSGCGQSTLLKAMVGLLKPWKGRIRIAGEEIGIEEEGSLARLRWQVGVLFQSGALIGSLTVGENVALPLVEFTALPQEIIEEMVQLKLDLVKLGRYSHLMPAELSGGMRKRAGLARAMALDPKILFCDEPAAGLDPATASEIDGLLLELKAALGVTVVVVTHELWSIENISERCIMLDGEAKGIIATGAPQTLRDESKDPRVRAFFDRRIIQGSAKEIKP
jgi:phospholipid/cholesterol/gamma-HCH transport system ATP-binding protein